MRFNREYRYWLKRNNVKIYQKAEKRVLAPSIIVLSTILLSAFLLLIGMCTQAQSAQLDSEKAVRCIIGEASNQGYHGMLAVAVGIRNRGKFRGVYGCNAKHVDKEPEYIWAQARKAWRMSELERVHTGTHWENIKAYGTPYWVKDMVKVYEHKDHVFYKEKN